MKSKIKKYNAVIRIRSNKTGIIKERGFVSIAEADDEWHFLADRIDDLDIFFALIGTLGRICPSTANTGLARETRERRCKPSFFFYPITLPH